MRSVDSKFIAEEEGMTLLTVNQVSKHYRQGQIEVQALQQVSLSIDEGEFVALVGPSGSGKTTLLNSIGGLDRPSSGHIHLREVELTALSDADLSDFRLFQLGFIFQAYNLVPVLSALENVELIMLLQGRSQAECRQRAQEHLAMVGLDNMMHRRPAELSGGQQQRVAVARALAAEPKLVLADEPTANLDSENAAALLDIMHQLSREAKTTFLFSTHDPRVMDRAERIITLHDGAILNDKQQLGHTDDTAER